MNGYLIPVRENEVPAFLAPAEALEIIVRSKLGDTATADLEIYEDSAGNIAKQFRQGVDLASVAAKFLAALRSALLQKLKDGLLSAYVEAPSSGRYYRLPRYYWLNREHMVLDEPMRRYTEAAGYQDCMEGMPVLLDRSQIESWRLAVRLYADDQIGVSVSSVAEVADDANIVIFNRNSGWGDISAWYLDRIKAAPVSGFTRSEDEAAAKAVGISRDRWRELRKAHAPIHWGESGPKKKEN